MDYRQSELVILKKLKSVAESVTDNPRVVLDMTSKFMNQWFYSGSSVERLGVLFEMKSKLQMERIFSEQLMNSCLLNSSISHAEKRRLAWLRKRGLALVCAKGEKYEGEYEGECGIVKLLVDEGWGATSDVMTTIASFL